MKLSELRPCDGCGGPIAPTFCMLDMSQAIATRAAAQTPMAAYWRAVGVYAGHIARVLR